MHRSKLVISLLATLALVLVASESFGLTYTTLFSFDGTNGANPNADLTLIGSTLYGTALGGGANNYGTVFSEPVTGGSPTVLANFSFTAGWAAYGDLTPSGSTLYGMTEEGGASDSGAVFSVPATGGSITDLTSLNQTGTTPNQPIGSLTLSGSTLYGVTLGGGTGGDGTVFSLSTTGGTPAILGSFDGTNGDWAIGTLLLSASNLYGITEFGGTHNDGTIFSIAVTGGNPNTLVSFNGTDGNGPTGGLVQSESTLYGMTTYGGANGDGVIFSVPLTGGTPTVLASFNGTDGKNPSGGLTLSANGQTLYGMTSLGGPNNLGEIFSIPITGGTPTILHSFGGLDGAEPSGSLTLSADGSTLYGTTHWGGATYTGFNTGDGAVFALQLVPEPSSVVLLGLGAIGLVAIAVRRRMRKQAS